VAARVMVEGEALDRLAELGLSVEIIEKTLRRAEAEAATCTAFDPPIMAGFMRYGRTIRFLREDLVPAGWEFDNPRNFCRTIHPSRKFALVATSGDEGTGNPKLTPTTKHPKGYATVRAVETNGQLTLDFPGIRIEAEGSDAEQLATWFLLYRVTEDEIRAEVSLPNGMVGANITDWLERVILPSFPREDDRLAAVTVPDDGGLGEYVVEVNRR
jgi:hypothetical protein